MTNRFQELRDKEVIHVCEGTRLGYVNDLVIDICCGRVTALIVLVVLVLGLLVRGITMGWA